MITDVEGGVEERMDKVNAMTLNVVYLTRLES